MISPELGTTLDDLVSRVESGDITEEEAAREAPIGEGNSVGVEIHLSGNLAGVVQFLEGNGVTPLLVDRDYIEAFVPVSLLRQISDLEGVLYVETILPPLPPQLPQEIPGDGPRVHRSAAWNAAGFTGKGIKIGVIDSGFDGFGELMGVELPATVKAWCKRAEIDASQGLERCDGGYFGVGATNHGTVVAETIIDIAPEAELYLGVPSSLGDLRNIVSWMISEGVLVINASQRYRFDGPGDGTSSKRHSPLNTVDHAVENNVVWVNSAGNDARGSWFGTPTDADGDGVLEFGGTEQLRVLGNYSAQLRWEGAWGGQSLDLDLYFYDTDGNVISRSINPQDGGARHVPYEILWLSPRGSILQVANRSDRLPGWVQIVAVEAFMEDSTGNGSITNGAESANAGMLAVGASHWQRVDTIEDYSSLGPTPDGRVKPDLVGVACGETTLAKPFCGTSASSPHVAGMAALVRQRFPDYTPQQVVAYLKNNAEQREDGLDPNNTWGHGFAVLPYGVLTDRVALAALYESTDGANWAKNTNWLSDRPLGEWHGVTTDADGRVTVVDLRRNRLRGELPAELGYLSELVLLNLGANQLSGEIPAELGTLDNLVGLHLFRNQLNGEIPEELSSLANLKGMSIHSNRLSGRIPIWLGDLPNLTGLWLNDNRLSGDIPAELGNLANLTNLNLNGNSLAGPIPSELGSLVNLAELVLNDNRLSGDIPAELGKLTNLASLDLQRNSLAGPIPSELGNLANLTALLLSNNQLSGAIPAELGTLANLEQLDLGNNQLSGEVPGELGRLSDLIVLRLTGNASLSGPLPRSLTGLTSLRVLWPSGTGLCAPTDAAFRSWLGGVENTRGVVNCSSAAASPDRDVLVALYNATNGPNWTNNTNWLTDEPIGEWHGVTTDEDRRVTTLNLRVNGLSGRMPAELGNLTNLQELWLAGNQLSGPIPPELGDLANLQALWLESNQLSGRIPAELGNLANLQELALIANDLSGPIPPELGTLAKLQVLLLHENQLSGRIPAELGNLANLQELALNANDLSGPIPPELGNLANLEWLELGANQLSGPIPPVLGSLASLLGLWLDNNELSGPFPDSFTGLDALLTLTWHSTELCAPTDAAFQAWLRGVEVTDGENCTAAASPDRDVLVALYNATNGPNWTNNTNWLTDEPIGEWHGVTTDEDRRVTTLNLRVNGLSGRMPAELGNLTNLQELWLAGNQLSGRIPPELGNLANLRVLALGNNRLSGPIPSELGNLVNLRILQLRTNQLSGPFPDSFTGLDVLESFWWYETQLCAPTDAAFQAWLRGVEVTDGENCTAAASLDRDVLVALYNATDGPNWTNNTNWLTDEPIGEWYGVTTDGSGHVTDLLLRSNGLTGRMPSELGNLAKLEELDLYDNALNGPIPAELGSLASLEGLGLHDNQLSGTVPSELGRLRNLGRLNLHNNRFSGPLPSELASIGTIWHLNVSGTELCAPTDDAFQVWLLDINAKYGVVNCAEVVVETSDRDVLVALYNATDGPNWTDNTNWLSGEPIREWFGVVTNEDGHIVRLDLEQNQLYGLLPSELGNLADLEELLLGLNQLSGRIPTELGNLANLQVLSLGVNQLSGRIPSELGNLSNLEFLHLSSNQLSGRIPSELGDLASLGFLHLESNQLSGPFPDSFTGLGALLTLTWQSTELCAPTDAAFQSWLSGVRNKSGENCVETASNDYDNDDDGLIEVANLAQLNAIRWDLDGDGTPSSNTAGYSAAFSNAAAGMGCPAGGCTGYELAENLDFDTNGNGQADSGDDYWNGGEGWDPIGSTNDRFSASFDGGGHRISNLHIDREGNDLGLFGYATAGSEIKNIGLIKASVTGTGDGRGSHIGGLVGVNRGAIDNSYASDGMISGNDIVGGLVGGNYGSVTNSHSSANVTGQGFYAGGLVGRMCGPISNSYASGDVNGDSHVGGLAGGSLLCEPGLSPITASYATGRVTGNSSVGGLVGSSRDPINDSYATGNVIGDTKVGGLVGGTNAPSTTITNSYATGRVTGHSDVGGLLGYNFTSGTTATSSYWDIDTSGQTSSAVGESMTTSELQSPTSNTGIYSTWDPQVWDFGTSNQYPRLRNAGAR